mgnify:CR=1 FL=1
MNEQTLSDLQKRRHTRALQIIKRWRLMDDDFMKRCLKNNIPAVECILRIIMEQPDLHVLSVTIEDTIPSLLGHGIRMDVHAVDSAGTEYDIEVQRSDKGAGARRARFNSSLLDLNSLKKGNTYDQLPESYVIFITENYIFKAGLARYHINRIIEELSRPFNDGEHIIYVNGDYRGSDDIGKLMNDFRSSKVDDMILEPLKETVNRYKNNPREVAAMCADLEKWSMDERSEGRAEGRAEGRTEGAELLARLLKLLQAEGRTDDVKLALEDKEARERLYKEYHLE